MSDMECYCEPDMDGDGANSSVWNVGWRTARRAYKCCECHETIKPGDRHEYIFAVCDGDPMQFRTCEFCALEYQRLREKHPDVTWLKGNNDLACLLVWDLRNDAAKEQIA